MIAIALLLALMSFGAFGLATDDQSQRVMGQQLSASTKTRWRVAAWLALGLSAAASIMARGLAFGLVWWLGFMMLAAGAVFLILNFLMFDSVARRHSHDAADDDRRQHHQNQATPAPPVTP